MRARRYPAPDLEPPAPSARGSRRAGADTARCLSRAAGRSTSGSCVPGAYPSSCPCDERCKCHAGPEDVWGITPTTPHEQTRTNPTVGLARNVHARCATDLLVCTIFLPPRASASPASMLVVASIGSASRLELPDSD